MKNKTLIITVCSILGVALIAIMLIILLGNKTYQVYFDSDGGSFVPSQEVKKGENIQKPVNPTRDGYDFGYWSLDNKEYDFTSKVEGDLILKAIWSQITVVEPKYQLTFNVDGKTKIIEVSESGEIDLETLNFEEKEGYEIKWYVDDKEYDLTTPISGDITIVGKYEKVDTTKYTIKFNTDGGSKIDNQSIKKGEKVKEPLEPTKYGYIFDGWYQNNTKYDFSKEVTSKMTLTAKWKEDPNVKRYTVKYEVDGKVTSTKTVLDGTKASTITSPKKDGYKFDGWYNGNTKYDFNTKVTKDLTLVAKFTELTKYTVTFEVDGKVVDTKIVVEGNKVTAPSDPKKDGWTFKEWRLDDKAYDFGVVRSNITLKAFFTQNPISYTVTFEADGKVVDTKNVVEGNKVTAPPDPKKDGWIFKGWYLETTKYEFNSPVNSNITLKAEWDEAVKNYKVVATRADNYSPDSILKVFEDNKQISVKEIKYTDGVHLCDGTKLVVTTSDIKTEKSLTVVLNSGKEVKATLIIE